eukprot:EG_transcript_17769
MELPAIPLAAPFVTTGSPSPPSLHCPHGGACLACTEPGMSPPDVSDLPPASCPSPASRFPKSPRNRHPTSSLSPKRQPELQSFQLHFERNLCANLFTVYLHCSCLACA